MKICHFDAFSGISGDMTVGALLDAGADFDALHTALTSLGLGASFRLEKTKRRGIAASKFHVEGGETKAHRHLSHILKILEAAPLADPVKRDTEKVFRRLAESEAKVHGTSIEKVHFHEVGAVDSICDIVGACFCLHNLGVEQVSVSPINLGSGTVQTEHGLLPVPAPATADMVRDLPVYARGPEVELTTPTGAALASALGSHFGSLPSMNIRAAGYGAGDRDFPVQANVLRAVLGESRTLPESESVAVLEANIDDATPQVLGYAMDSLLEAGALDVTLTPLWMKKNRPGTLFTVLARPEDQERLAGLMLRETTTLGLRIHTAERRVQARESVEVDTPHGRIRIKRTPAGGFAPEYDDCVRQARERGVPLRQVLADASFAYLNSTR